MEGRDTELDRSVLEAIKDPLTHLVRNAVDHGIEPPDVRVAHGKPAEGMLKLRAYHEAGQVHLEIIDDGGGINPERDRGEGAGEGPDHPGPALADESAGRLAADLPAGLLDGRRDHERLRPRRRHGRRQDPHRGHRRLRRRHLDPRPGHLLRLTIPLTLAIIPALTIGCAGRRYASRRSACWSWCASPASTPAAASS
jgi:two-component system chemotaxis sensor kinase CheA